MSTPMLRVHVDAALAAGLTEQQAGACWREYCAWSAREWPERGLGGRSWQSAIDLYLRKLSEGYIPAAAPEDEAAARARRARELQAAKEANAAYTADARPFDQWCMDLLARQGAGERLPAHEASVAEWYSHQGAEVRITDWLAYVRSGGPPVAAKLPPNAFSDLFDTRQRNEDNAHEHRI
jgi:hypothetical protein